MAQQPEDRSAGFRASLKDVQAQFLVVVREMRPKLHRFCARMCGSVLDGEDLVQETLAQAFYRLPSLQDPSRLEPWLFRIAHRKCVDFLRSKKRQREDTVSYDDREPELPAGEEREGEPIGDTLAPLVGELPPKERAAVLLKDLLQYSLTEVAEVIDSTVGGVKAALHRGRAKLRALQNAPAQTELDARKQKLLLAYVDCFNRRDWSALHELIAIDARLEVVEATEGKVRDAPYFANYAALPWEWKLSAAWVDGEPLVVHWKKVGQDWRPHAAIRLWWQDDKVVRIKDYVHVDYLMREARIADVQGE
ncbi:MAG TPA: sigma-70 family RNA polymerase sigma factor [Burkholderiales bacterium]|nr:sigma-70 family RNA polymerase sigma factor [Burkholderiales bacterium]